MLQDQAVVFFALPFLKMFLALSIQYVASSIRRMTAMAKKTATKWALHKLGTNQFGYMCSFQNEAEQMLDDLKKDVLHMPEKELKKYKVVKIALSWDE